MNQIFASYFFTKGQDQGFGSIITPLKGALTSQAINDLQYLIKIDNKYTEVIILSFQILPK